MTHDQTYNHDIPSNKMLYKSLIERKSCKPISLAKWSDTIGAPTQSDCLIFTSKIKIKDNKIAEFNYKVINNILACKLNLYKWKIAQASNCDICGKTQDIIHLLYQCQNAKKRVGICRKTHSHQN